MNIVKANIKLKLGEKVTLEMVGYKKEVTVARIIPHPELKNSVYYEFSNGEVCRDERLQIVEEKDKKTHLDLNKLKAANWDLIQKDITDNSDLEFKDLSDEEYRCYYFSDMTIRINNPSALNVSASGGHRVLDSEGISHYIPSGWRHLIWKVKEGCKPFAF